MAAAHAEGMQLLSVTAEVSMNRRKPLTALLTATARIRTQHRSKPPSPSICNGGEPLHPATIDDAPRIRLRFAVAAEELSVRTRDLAVAVQIMHGRRVPESSATSIAEPSWYASRSAPAVVHAVRGHFTPRSVFFQNAVRLAVGLAAARLIAGELDLSHGFWMLLATLTLMRTSVATTRAAVVPAFLGTIAGGLVAALVLALAGADSTVYEVAFPFVMVLALAAGPLIGPVAGQAMFTLLVALLFAQMAPVSWRLAEVRVLDVVLGGLPRRRRRPSGLATWRNGRNAPHRQGDPGAAANDLESTVGSLTHREVAAAGQQDTAACRAFPDAG